MTITVAENGKTIQISDKEGASLLELLRSQGIYVSAACGGKGTCGKCKVQMLSGATKIGEMDRKHLSEEELEAGWRLACTAYPKDDCWVKLGRSDESGFEAVAEHSRDGERKNLVGDRTGKAPIMSDTTDAEAATEATATVASGYDIAIDIGTTTIAMELIKRNTGEVLHTVTSVNHQRAFGADVISRIRAANEGHGAELRESIQRDLLEGIGRLLKESGTAGGSVRRIAIAGNTTMGHLLMGYSCETLGTYPFTPINIGIIRTTVLELLGGQLAAKTVSEDVGDKAVSIALDPATDVVLLPGITTYVGADIAAGMLDCDFDRREKPCLLIDLGTNGEMAVGNRERILVTSTAAGPAFEGGNISCGMGSVPGAISHVEIDDAVVGEPRVWLQTSEETKDCSRGSAESGVRFQTIGGRPPIGLCGTGVIETTYELVKVGFVDETGMLEENYFEDGFKLARTPEGRPIVFTQKDVREMQLAKSAVRAGLETLLKRYGITYEDVERVFLAGGFGYKADLEKMVGIGMLPEELRAKTTAIGNASLAGAALYLTTSDAEERLKKLVEISTEVELSSDRDFNDFYMEYMFF